MHKKTLNILILILAGLIIFQISSNLLFTLNYNNVILKAKAIKLKYIVLNWLENQIYSDEKSLPEFNWQHGTDRFQCSMPILNHNDTTAVQHLSADFRKLRSLFEACPLSNKSYQLDKLINISHIGPSAFKVHLRMDLVRSDFTDKLTKKLDPLCSNWYLDKKINVSEITNELEFGPEVVLQSNNNWTFTTNKSGYYFVKCVDLFEFVYTVLPANMSTLMERRKAYQRNEELALSAVKENPLVKDAEFENCSDQANKNRSKEDKMNVLVIGFDSISSVHFKRVFPLTFAALKQTKGKFDGVFLSNEISYAIASYLFLLILKKFPFL